MNRKRFFIFLLLSLPTHAISIKTYLWLFDLGAGWTTPTQAGIAATIALVNTTAAALMAAEWS